MCRTYFDGIKWALGCGKGSGGSVNITVSDNSKIEELFDSWYVDSKKFFLFKPLEKKRGKKNENVGGKVVSDWNVIFPSITKHKKVKQETQAVDEGGPSRQFMALVWRRFTRLAVTVKGTGSNDIKIPLMRRNTAGYVLFTTDDEIKEHLNRMPPEESVQAREKVERYYQAIGRLYLHSLAMDNPIPTTALPPLYRKLLLRQCRPSDEDYPCSEILGDIRAMGFDLDMNNVIGTPFHIYFNDDNHDLITAETFFSVFVEKFYITSTNIALGAVREGLMIHADDNSGVSGIYRAVPSKVLDLIAFATPELTVDHVLAFLEPRYCEVVEYENEYGKPVEAKVEPQLIAEQEYFFNKTLPGVLRDLYEKDIEDKESYAKKIRRKRDILSKFVYYCTGSSYLPNPDIKQDGDSIFIEFSAVEMSEDKLPEAHTCVNTLKVPHTVWGNDADLLASKLLKAFRLISKFGSFGMQ